MTIYLAQSFILFASTLFLAPLAIACIAQALRIIERDRRNALANEYPLCVGIDGLATAMQAQAVALPESQGCNGVQRYTGKIMPYGIAKSCTSGEAGAKIGTAARISALLAALAALAWIFKDPSVLALAGGLVFPCWEELSENKDDTFSEDLEDFVNHYLNKERAQSVEFKALFDYPELLIKAERARKDIMMLESDFIKNELALDNAWQAIRVAALTARYNAEIDAQREQLCKEIKETCQTHNVMACVPRYRDSSNGEILYWEDRFGQPGWVLRESNATLLREQFPSYSTEYGFCTVLTFDSLTLDELKELKEIMEGLTQYPLIDEDHYSDLQSEYISEYLEEEGKEWDDLTESELDMLMGETFA